MTAGTFNRLHTVNNVEAIQVTAIDPRGHTMGWKSLLTYLEIKVHHLLQEKEWRRVRVIGAYDRGCDISRFEKTDKMFNWQRPTADVNGDEIVIKCFPGRDYVRHYGLIIATYQQMVGRQNAGPVLCEIPSPQAVHEAASLITLDVKDVDLVIVGWGLEHFTGSEGWAAGPGYAFKRDRLGGRNVMFLGFFHSIWGDVAGRVVGRLAALGARRVVYVGKVGTLRPGVVPNTCLATGSESVLHGETTRWVSYFGDLSGYLDSGYGDNILTGIHVTSPSILLENRRWLAANRGRLFVDPEIGPMGAAAREAGIDFGYLHVISNNLAHEYDEDLSNERKRSVVDRRHRLLDQIQAVICSRLQETAGHRTGREADA